MIETLGYMSKSYVRYVVVCIAAGLLWVQCAVLPSEIDPISGSTWELAIPLPDNDRTLTRGSIGVDEERWYYFDAVLNQTYALYIDDGSPNGSGAYTCWLNKPDVYHPDLALSNAYSLTGRGFYPEEPYTFTADATERIYIQLTPATSNSSGSFGVAVDAR